MTEREALAHTLMSIYWGEDMSGNPTSLTVHALKLAEWVIKDRERICKPLVECTGAYFHTIRAINETLKLAGIDEKGKD